MADSEARTYTVRPMRPEEAEEMYSMIDKEGWNLTHDKFVCLHKARPELFYVCVSDKGELAGTMSLYPTFPNEFALGNIVVHENHRFRGLGRKLVNDILSFHPGSVVSLTAVPGADQFYLNTGFKFTEPQQGHIIFHMDMDRKILEQRARRLPEGVSVSPYSEEAFDELVAYDRVAKGYSEKSYLEMQIQCFKVFIARNTKGQLVGFAVGFIKRGEIVVDGLFADSDAVAVHLTVAILKGFSDKREMKLQVPSSKPFLSELGKVISSYIYNRYSLGCPTPSDLAKVYNVGDCDYTY